MNLSDYLIAERSIWVARPNEHSIIVNTQHMIRLFFVCTAGSVLLISDETDEYGQFIASGVKRRCVYLHFGFVKEMKV